MEKSLYLTLRKSNQNQGFINHSWNLDKMESITTDLHPHILGWGSPKSPKICY